MQDGLYDSIVNAAYCALPGNPLAMETSIFLVAASLCMAVSYITIGSIFLWLMSQSVIIRRSNFVYILVALMYVGGLGNLAQIFPMPDMVRVTVQLFNAGVALTAMASLWRQKHYLLRIVYQFKYTMGLLKNLDILDSAGKKK